EARACQAIESERAMPVPTMLQCSLKRGRRAAVTSTRRRPGSSESRDRRPIGQYGWRRWIVLLERPAAVNDFAVHDGQYRLDCLNAVFRNCEIILGQHDHIGQLPYFEHSLFLFLPAEPGATDSKKSQRIHATQAVRLRIKSCAAQRFARDQPPE